MDAAQQVLQTQDRNEHGDSRRQEALPTRQACVRTKTTGMLTRNSLVARWGAAFSAESAALQHVAGASAIRLVQARLTVPQRHSLEVPDMTRRGVPSGSAGFRERAHAPVKPLLPESPEHLRSIA